MTQLNNLFVVSRPDSICPKRLGFPIVVIGTQPPILGASGIFIVRNGLSDDIQNNKVSNRYNDQTVDQTVTNQPAIVLSIQPQPDANTVEIVDGVKQMLSDLLNQIPKSMELGIFYDCSKSIRATGKPIGALAIVFLVR
jgi:hypothetical protein